MSSAASQAQFWTIQAILRWASEDFRARGIETPRLDAEVLLGFALSMTRVQLIVDSNRPLDPDELGRFRDLVKRRRAREPVAYLVGCREFYGRRFAVDRRVLVPRPDTETLVDVALERSNRISLSMRALDLCTGSGCVAVTLGRERPTSRVMATDLSADALALATVNAQRLGAYNVAFRRGDLFEAVDPACRFDVITSNPPYIATGDIDALPPDVREYEPRLALDGGTDGLALVRRIVGRAPAHLAADGVLAVEVVAGGAGDVANLFAAAGLGRIEIKRDYARIERVVSGVLERE